VGQHVLILANRKEEQSALVKVLADHGYIVTCLDPSSSFPPHIDRNSCDCILVEQQCGEMDCVSLIKRIREQQPLETLPVLLLADNKSNYYADAFHAGASGDIALPWREDQLLAKIEVQLKLRDACQRLKTQLENNRRQHAQLQADLALGQQVQQSFLPPSQLRTEYFSLEARLFAVGDLSGDYFDYALLTPQRLVVFLADVSGHGIASALLANRLKAFFDENARSAHRPRLFMERLNRIILDLGDHYHIATAVCLHIDIAETVITYASAGHRTMYWLDTDDVAFTELPATGPALGMFKEFEINEINRGFMPGRNRLVAYTDGLVEFKLADDKWITEERFRDEVMLPNSDLRLAAYVTELLESSRRLTGGAKWEDDVSLLVADF